MSRRRKLLWWLLPPLLLLALLAGANHRIESQADRLATTGTAAIKLLTELGAGLREQDPARVAGCYADHYDNPEGARWSQQRTSERDGVEVFRWQREEVGAVTDKAAVEAQMARLLEGVNSLEVAKAKLGRVIESSEDRAVVAAVLWLRGEQADGHRFESQASLRLHLERSEQPTAGWQITRQELLEGTTTLGRGDGFVDIAAAAGLDHRGRINPRFATAEWAPKAFEILPYGSAGVSAADADGDGWVDLYFGDGIEPRLYRNLGPGEDGELRFTDITAASGLPVEAASTNVALFVDLDEDGDDDLFLGRFMDQNLLFRNDGPDDAGIVQFTDLSANLAAIATFVTVASAADYDGDGDLDLYLGRYLDPRVDLPTTLFYTRNGQGNSLLRNDGDFRFTEVTASAGVSDGGLTLGTAWADYDEDGDVDLYVANDFGRNALLRNDGPDESGNVRFADVSAESGAIDFGFGMSSSWGDADNDGDLDLYVSNVHSGQRWYGQSTTLYRYLLNSLRQGTLGDDFDLYREIYGYTGADWRDYGDAMVKGNSLLLNDGGRFEDRAEIAGANPFGWYWGSAFLDFDNDGRQDLYANNGWISGETHDDL
ncbi:MAG: VCBS repeat-containing protein [Acidobacteriota bacterium]